MQALGLFFDEQKPQLRVGATQTRQQSRQQERRNCRYDAETKLGLERLALTLSDLDELL